MITSAIYVPGRYGIVTRTVTIFGRERTRFPRMSRRLGPFVPVALCALGLAASAACVLLAVLDRARIHSFGDVQPAGPVLGVSFSLLGALIVSRRPGNRIGWIYLLIGVAMPLQALGALYYERAVIAGGPGGRWGAWLSNWASIPVFPTGLALFAFLLYPSGRLPSARWRRVAQAAVVLFVLLLVVALLDPTPIDVAGGFPKAASPTGVAALGSLPSIIGGLLYFLGLVLIAAAIGGLAFRARRAPALERQQVKLLAYAAALTIVALIAVSIVSAAGVSVGNGSWDVPVVFGFGIAVPVACGVAILRHGLYEIDRLISRTISYALLTGLLVGVFAGLILLTTRVLPFSSPVGVAASTLAAAGLFSPLRNRVQRMVDRRFNRARYDAEKTVSAFGLRLRDAVEVDTVVTELAASVSYSLEPTHVTVWTRS
jgi:hypothetical protein